MGEGAQRVPGGGVPGGENSLTEAARLLADRWPHTLGVYDAPPDTPGTRVHGRCPGRWTRSATDRGRLCRRISVSWGP